jgi:hypothetical protein
MERFSFSGGYQDRHGREAIDWRVEPSDRQGPWPGYELHTVIRGVAFWGYDLDSLEPADHAAAHAAGFSLQPTGDLYRCILTGDLPCALDEAGRIVPGTVSFRLDLYPPGPAVFNPKNLQLATTVRGQRFEVTDDWFEDGVLRLEGAVPAPVRLVCCVTCQLSDYSPLGHGLMGMRCHRDAKQQYLAVRSKQDYWNVPVTEEVPETYRCPQYQRRVPGTGYRG